MFLPTFKPEVGRKAIKVGQNGDNNEGDAGKMNIQGIKYFESSKRSLSPRRAAL